MKSPDRADLQRQKNYCEMNRKLASLNSTKLTQNLIPVSKLVPKPSMTFSAGSSSLSTSMASLSRTDQSVALHVVKTIRWISAWDLWLYVLKTEMKPYVTEFMDCNRAHQDSAKELLILELKSMTSGVASCASSSSQKDVRVMFLLIDIWEHVRREGVSVLSALQITSCEHKSELKRVRLDQLLKLELGQETIIAKILYITRTIDSLYEELEVLVDKHIDTKCLPIGIDPHVSAALVKLRTRDETAFALPPETMEKYLNSNKTRKAPLQGTISHTSPLYNLPDFFEPLFVGRQIPSDVTIRACASRYDRIIEIAIEWFMAWCLFGESIFDELSHLTDSSRTFKGQRGFLEKQIAHIQNITTELKEIHLRAESCHVLMKGCLFILESLTSLLEITKHESSYLIHHLETFIIRNDGKYLKKMPENPIAARIYCLRNVVLSKDRMLTTSTEYLYREISFLIELVESKFHNREGYLNEFGPLTARLMSKYTNRRKEMIQLLDIAPGYSEPKDLNRPSSSTDVLDQEETNKSLGSLELEEASSALTPENLKSCPWTLPSPSDSAATETQSSASAECDPWTSTSSTESQTQDSNSNPGLENRTRLDSGVELSPNVFELDSTFEQSTSEPEQEVMTRSVPAKSKSRIWNSLVRKFSSQKTERR